MKKPLVILLALALLCCAACGRNDSGQKAEGLRIYYAVSGREQAEKGLVDYITVTVPEDAAPLDYVLERIFAPPEREGLASPYPQGTRVLEAQQRDKQVVLRLSNAYSELNGLEETIADYCIVLSLCQLEGVESVSIRAQNGGDKFALRPEDVILGG